MEKPFQGLATFLKSPVNDLNRQIGVVGVPFDGATSFRPGARFAPNAIRQASMMLTDGHHPIFETEPSKHVTDLGDIFTSNAVSKALGEITDFYATHPMVLAGKPILTMGGDHTISLPILRALRQVHDEDIVLIHFDAHCDTWEDHFGEPIGHGTWVRNVVDEGLVRPVNIASIGLRSPVAPEIRNWLLNKGACCYTARGALSVGPARLAGTIKKMVGKKRWYISFDIDALDPSFAPGTGTPEIGGLTPHFVLDILETIHESFGENFLGMDVVEVNPSFDPTSTTALAAATLLWTVSSILSRK